MKEYLCKLLLLVALLSVGANCSAYDFISDGIAYNILPDSVSCEVTFDDVDSNKLPLSSYSGNIVIPDKVIYNSKEYAVTYIGYYAFRKCAGLTSVQIPNSVVSIATRAFELCTGLTELKIPNSVTNIVRYAFNACVNLKSITLSNSLNSLNEGILSDCSSLQSIDIPDSVISVGDYTFSGCTSLQSVVIPDSVTSLGDYAFSDCSGLTSVVLGKSVASVGNYAFSGCTGLKMIVSFNETPPSYKPQTFENVPADAVVLVPEHMLLSYGSWGSFANIYGGDGYCEIDNLKFALKSHDMTATFVGCIDRTVKNVAIPGTVTDGGNVYMVTAIKDSAFSGNTILESLLIPDSVTSIGDKAFYNCIGLKSVVIGNSVESIGYFAFQGCSGIKSLVIPDSVTSLGMDAFVDCSGLEEVKIGNSLQYVSGFWGCTKLKRIEFGKSVSSIYGYAFGECVSLTSVILPDLVTYIGENAFVGCKGLKEVTFGKSVEEIKDCAFKGCAALENIIIPDNVTHIWDAAFGDCVNLTSVTIGKSVRCVSNKVFGGCPNLTSVYCRTFEPPLCMIDAFDSGIYDSAILFVPVGSKGKYENNFPFNKFKNIMEYDFSDVEDVQIGEVTISVSSGAIMVAGSAGEIIEVYDIRGQRVYDGTGMCIQLDKGVYVVRVAGFCRKVILQ